MRSRPNIPPSRPRDAPIDPEAVALVERLLPYVRSDRSHERTVNATCNYTRIRIIRALAETPLAASDLARLVGRTPAATSQHIRVLRAVGAVQSARSGNVVRYRLTNAPSAKILATFARSFDALADQ